MGSVGTGLVALACSSTTSGTSSGTTSSSSSSSSGDTQALHNHNECLKFNNGNFGRTCNSNADCAVDSSGTKCNPEGGTCFPCGFVCVEIKSKPGTRRCFLDDAFPSDMPCSSNSQCVEKISAEFCCSNDIQTVATKESYARCLSSNDVICLNK